MSGAATRRSVGGAAARASRSQPKADRGEKRLDHQVLEAHFSGANEWDVVGLHPAGPDNLYRFLVIDIDYHGKEPDPQALQRNSTAALQLWGTLTKLGFSPWLLDSDGKGGFHLWIVFAEPINTRVAYHFGRWLVHDFQTLSLLECPEVFPKQEQLGKGEFGNWIRLPGRHHTDPHHWSRMWSSSHGWMEGAGVCECIIKTADDPVKLIPDAALPPERQQSQHFKF